MESLDLLFARVTDIGKAQVMMQEQLEKNTMAVDHTRKEQQVLSQQIDATGKAVAQLILDHRRPPSPAVRPTNTDVSPSYRHESQDNRGPNSFAGPQRPGQGGSFDRALTPKIAFPHFDGKDPKIWRTKCEDYFQLYNVPDHLRVSTAAIHMGENPARWYHIYKLKVGVQPW